MSNLLEKGIEKLYKRQDIDSYGTVYGTIPPSTNELMEKINELIDKVNNLETKIETLCG